MLQLKQKWGTLQKIFSSKSRLEKIVMDILMDMSNKPRLMDGRGNAMLVSGSIYQACKLYELFAQTELAGKCAIVTSYKPSPADIKGEETGEGLTERLRQYDIYHKMLAQWFREPEDSAMVKVKAFEIAVKKQFVEAPGQMKLLIVVDKPLTGFGAPPATYLYIDKPMRDHDLFQAICRVNRLDGEDKEYGYIVDYKDLFHSLESAVGDYTSGALDGYDAEDVQGLLSDRLGKSRERLEETRELIWALCEPVAPPQEAGDFLRYFCGNTEDPAALSATAPRRMALYKATSALIRAYAAIANELEEAGYPAAQQATIRNEVRHFDAIRNEIKLSSGDYIDLKAYEPTMRHLIDSYIRADESRKISELDDYDLVDLLASRGPEAAIASLPKALQAREEAVAEVIENNIRSVKKDGWRGNKFKEREVLREVKRHLSDPEDVARIFALVKEQRDY